MCVRSAPFRPRSAAVGDRLPRRRGPRPGPLTRPFLKGIRPLNSSEESSTRTSTPETTPRSSASPAVENLLAAPRWRGPAEKQLLRDCMSVDKKFVFHRLNAEGLHVLRVLVSKRVSEYVRESRRASLRFGAVAAEEACDDSVFNATFYAKRLIDEGIIIVPDAHRISPTTRDMLRGRSGFVRRVLEAASGFHKIEISEFGKVAIFTHGVKDVQNYMHSDTFQPTWKMWLFEPTAMGQGPFHYVPRSHLATEGRLRWIYDRTKGLVNANLVRLGNQYDDSVCVSRRRKARGHKGGSSGAVSGFSIGVAGLFNDPSERNGCGCGPRPTPRVGQRAQSRPAG
ncbi:hypothetical protein M885DRAFT_6421 [Pelagophyceae sp. CCMP2097]|nr:hypothetical protein M885DRAFT_6421 [Pelagophyceae sp. CCMP2097]